MLFPESKFQNVETAPFARAIFSPSRSSYRTLVGPTHRGDYANYLPDKTATELIERQ
jgi:hypothetical protein